MSTQRDVLKKRINFGTKAETLERLRPVLRQAIVLPQALLPLNRWRKEPSACLDEIRNTISPSTGKVIVRSSSRMEDTARSAQAGRFKSLMDIDIRDKRMLGEAIHEVFASFGSAAPDDEQVFIQPMLDDVAMSGVVFTRDLDSLSPYYVVNYDDQSRKTDTVTSGKSSQLKTLIKFRDTPTKQIQLEPLFKAVTEIEEWLGSDALDIEFALSGKGQVFLLQVRPLALHQQACPDARSISHYLEKVFKKIDKVNVSNPYLHGDRTFLGIMSDWNPAEMLGVKPRPLALSLYKDLITDKTWAYQRDNYGYRNLRSCPLLITLIGHPYMDIRTSFNSFIPKGLDDQVAKRLCSHYLNQLERNPSSHDKVEFDIVFSCSFLNIDKKLAPLQQEGFSKSEIAQLKASLVHLTNNIIKPGDSVFQTDLNKVNILQERQETVLASKLTDLEKIYWLVEDCRRYGTLPFAGLARAGFIAVQLLRSLVDTKIITNHELNRFMASLTTVAKQMQFDRHQMSRADFLSRYGHLRPGTYDILSPSYDEAFDLYFSEPAEQITSPAGFAFNASALRKLDRALAMEGFIVDASELLLFIRRAIEGREHAKLIFTRSVSKVLDLVKHLSSRYSISAEDAAFVDIRTLLHLYATLDHRDLRDILVEEIARNKYFYQFTEMIRLPSLIMNPDNVYEFHLDEGKPNFVTLGRCHGEIVHEEHLLSRVLEGKIIFIPSADPGYDWIFARKMAGLVTMYGGANSHMAIRAAELRIPAVIGAGEKNYKDWSRASVLEIDSGNKQVRVVK